MARLLVFVLLILFGKPAFALDRSIRILGIYPPQVASEIQFMRTQLLTIQEAWINTGLPATSQVIVELVNNAQPVAVNLPGVPAGNTSAILTWAMMNPLVHEVRQQYAADIVILFADSNDPNDYTCGINESHFAVRDNFHPGANGLDLRGANQYFIAVVRTNHGCHDSVAAHEFGHLLGAGHAIDPNVCVNVNWPSPNPEIRCTAQNERLYDDALAYMQVSRQCVWTDFGTCLFMAVSAVAADVMVDPLECASAGYTESWQLPQCTYVHRYSRNVSGLGDSSHNAERALRTTALSVANYIQTDTTPPVLNPPINVFGYVTYPCDFGWTGHMIFWQPDPATNVPVYSYQIWKSQPPGSFYEYGWSVPSVQLWTEAWGTGADAEVRVAACSDVQCSGLSLTSYYAPFLCPVW